MERIAVCPGISHSELNLVPPLPHIKWNEGPHSSIPHQNTDRPTPPTNKPHWQASPWQVPLTDTCVHVDNCLMYTGLPFYTYIVRPHRQLCYTQKWPQAYRQCRTPTHSCGLRILYSVAHTVASRLLQQWLGFTETMLKRFGVGFTRH